MRSYLNILIFILLMSSCSEDEEITYGVSEPEIDQNTGTSDNYVKDILKEKNYDVNKFFVGAALNTNCLLYTSPSPRDATLSRMPSSA